MTPALDANLRRSLGTKAMSSRWRTATLAMSCLCAYGLQPESTESSGVYIEPSSAAPIRPAGGGCGTCVPFSELDPDFMLKNDHFLPPRAHDQCRQSKAGKRLSERIARLASPECKMDRALKPRAIEFGFGATLFSLFKPMLHALKNDYCVVNPSGLSRYRNLKECSGGWPSLLQEFSPNRPEYNPIYRDLDFVTHTYWGPRLVMANSPEMTPEKAAKLTVERQEKYAKMRHPHRASLGAVDDTDPCARWFEAQSWTYGYTTKGVGLPINFACDRLYSYSEHGSDVLPHEARDAGLFMTVAHITKHILRPSAWVRGRIAAAKRRMGWTPGLRMIGVHVRRGDSCLEARYDHGRKCSNFSEYMAHVERIADRYGIYNVYISTDSSDALAHLDKYPEYKFYYDKAAERGGIRNRMKIEWGLALGKVDGCHEAADVIKDIILLSETDALVGKFSSNIDRLAYQLMSARSGDCYRPFISMDANWCFDYALPSGDNHGKLFLC